MLTFNRGLSRRLLLLSGLAWHAAHATDSETGYWLRDQCRAQDNACFHYINGVLGGATMAMAVTGGKTGITLPAAYEAFMNICVPAHQRVSIGRQVNVAIDYLENHPDELDQPAAGLVVVAQQRMWPCRPNGDEQDD
jgi:hypothetical protein